MKNTLRTNKYPRNFVRLYDKNGSACTNTRLSLLGGPACTMLIFECYDNHTKLHWCPKLYTWQCCAVASWKRSRDDIAVMSIKKARAYIATCKSEHSKHRLPTPTYGRGPWFTAFWNLTELGHVITTFKSQSALVVPQPFNLKGDLTFSFSFQGWNVKCIFF